MSQTKLSPLNDAAIDLVQPCGTDVASQTVEAEGGVVTDPPHKARPLVA